MRGHGKRPFFQSPRRKRAVRSGEGDQLRRRTEVLCAAAHALLQTVGEKGELFLLPAEAASPVARCEDEHEGDKNEGAGFGNHRETEVP